MTSENLYRGSAPGLSRRQLAPVQPGQPRYRRIRCRSGDMPPAPVIPPALNTVFRDHRL